MWNVLVGDPSEVESFSDAAAEPHFTSSLSRGPCENVTEIRLKSALDLRSCILHP